MIKWIIFDCDDTLVDSRSLVELFWKGYHNCYPDREKLIKEHFIPCYSLTHENSMSYLNILPEHRHNFLFRYALAENEDINDYFVPFPEMEDVLFKLHEQGYRFGINSSRDTAAIRMSRKQLGDLYDFFEIKVGSDQVWNPKPAPDSLYKCMEIACCSEEELLYIGDSKSDYECAKNAGVPFILAKWAKMDDSYLECEYKCDSIDKLYEMIEMLSHK